MTDTQPDKMSISMPVLGLEWVAVLVGGGWRCGIWRLWPPMRSRTRNRYPPPSRIQIYDY